VTTAIATWTVQDHYIVCRKTSQWEVRGADLHDSAFDLKDLPTPIKHFRHEWKTIESAVAIEGRKDIFGRSYEHMVTGAESTMVHSSLA
jgi:hypothetical protein